MKQIKYISPWPRLATEKSGSLAGPGQDKNQE